MNLSETLMKKIMNLAITLTALSAAVLAQTGGTYDLSHNVIGGGGERSSAGTITVEGTIGQPTAGAVSGSGAVRLRSGFWAFDQIGPTAASVAVTGRVLTSAGHGIVNVTVTMTGSFGETQNVRTSTFGYFRFLNVTAGRDYFVTVHSRRYDFVESTIFITVKDEISGIEFRSLQ